jgi:soluble lytic murein transglycosylase-like protein
MKFAVSCVLLVFPFSAHGPLSLPEYFGFALPSFSAPGGNRLQQPTVHDLESARVVDTHALIWEAASRHGVPVAFVKSIVAAESGFNCDAVSTKGAVGLMQLMPQTAREYGADPNIPAQNVDAGTHYLRHLMNRYRNYRNSTQRVIAAYNAGPAMVDRYHGVPPFGETRRYVARVLQFLRRFQKETPFELAGSRVLAESGGE